MQYVVLYLDLLQAKARSRFTIGMSGFDKEAMYTGPGESAQTRNEHITEHAYSVDVKKLIGHPSACSHALWMEESEEFLSCYRTTEFCSFRRKG